MMDNELKAEIKDCIKYLHAQSIGREISFDNPVDVIATLERALAQGQWVSVKTELPDIDEKVLTINESGTIKSDHRINVERDKGNEALFNREAKAYGGLVTHWQALPSTEELGDE